LNYTLVYLGLAVAKAVTMQCCSIHPRHNVCEHGSTLALPNTLAHDGHVIMSSRRFTPNGHRPVAILQNTRTHSYYRRPLPAPIYFDCLYSPISRVNYYN